MTPVESNSRQASGMLHSLAGGVNISSAKPDELALIDPDQENASIAIELSSLDEGLAELLSLAHSIEAGHYPPGWWAWCPDLVEFSLRLVRTVEGEYERAGYPIGPEDEDLLAWVYLLNVGRREAAAKG